MLFHLEVKKGTGVLLYKAKAPKRAPVGQLNPRRKAPTYNMNPYQQYAYQHQQQESDAKTDPKSKCEDPYSFSNKRPKMNPQSQAQEQAEDDKESVDIKGFCYPETATQSQTNPTGTKKKVRPFHQNDWDPKTNPAGLDEQINEVINTKQYDGRSMEEIQEDQRQAEWAHKVAMDAQ